MNEQFVKAHLNLCAVLKNLEDLVSHDPETALLVRRWEISVAFHVRGHRCRRLSISKKSLRLVMTSEGRPHRFHDVLRVG